MLYSIERGAEQYQLTLQRKESATVHDLFDAFQHNTPIPAKDAFVSRLAEKIADEQSIELSLRLDIK